MPESSDRGIIVLGAPRSGTTLVGRLLDAHPRICCPPETNLFSACSVFLEEHAFGNGLAVGVVPGLSFSGVSEGQVLAALKHLAFGLMRDVAAKAGKPRWAEKTAAAVFHIDGIERLVGNDCQYVCMVRHGLDVACSSKELSDKMGMYLPELHRYVQRYLSPIEALAHAWADSTTRLLRFAEDHQDNALLVRYEDLVGEPETTTGRLFSFLGEDPAQVNLDTVFERPSTVGLGDWKTFEARGFSTASIQRWKTELGAQASSFAPIVNPLLARLDYEPVPIAPRPNSAEARRLLELELMVARMRKNNDA